MYPDGPAADHDHRRPRRRRSTRARRAPATSTACSPSSRSCSTSCSPTSSMFGQKDAQQVFLVQRMVARPQPADRASRSCRPCASADGLALSSRNRYLDESQRAAALALCRGARGRDAAADRGIDAVLADGAVGASATTTTSSSTTSSSSTPRTFLPVDDDYRGAARRARRRAGRLDPPHRQRDDLLG